MGEGLKVVTLSGFRQVSVICRICKKSNEKDQCSNSFSRQSNDFKCIN